MKDCRVARVRPFPSAALAGCKFRRALAGTSVYGAPLLEKCNAMVLERSKLGTDYAILLVFEPKDNFTLDSSYPEMESNSHDGQNDQDSKDT